MKRPWFTVLLVMLFSNLALGQISSTGQLLDAMQTRYRGKWFKQFSFTQETITFDQNGAVRDTAIWHEAVSYPDHFRIDYNTKGRFVIFRSDSAYRFNDYQLQSSRLEPQEFLLFKGGLYYRPVSSIMEKLKEYGYNTDIFREDYLNGRRAYVIGAEKGDLKTKQFWIDADYFYTVRRISPISRNRTLDLQYSDHKRVEGGWVEQIVLILVDDRKVQIEYYLEIDAEEKLPENTFNPKSPSPDWFKH